VQRASGPPVSLSTLPPAGDTSGAPLAPAPIEPEAAEMPASAPAGGADDQTAETNPDALLAMRVIAAAETPTTGTVEGYRLGTGDKVRVTVYGEADLSGEFQVDGSGFVRLPLIGQVNASGHTLREFETDVAAKFADGYLRAPRVSAEVVNYRPFFILGEVNKPGEYPYVNGMNVVTAVALAGGFTYRADEDDVYIRRNGQPEVEYSADERTPVLPGDIIRVTERFF
jgi:polysaccharide export outer membrane protein